MMRFLEEMDPTSNILPHKWNNSVSWLKCKSRSTCPDTRQEYDIYKETFPVYDDDYVEKNLNDEDFTIHDDKKFLEIIWSYYQFHHYGYNNC